MSLFRPGTWFRRIETVGNVSMWVRRDNVEGLTFYKHPLHIGDTGTRGLWPYICQTDAKSNSSIFNEPTNYHLMLYICSGGTSDFSLNSEVLVNAGGLKATRSRGIETVPSNKALFSEQRSHICDFPCDQEWFEVLQALPSARISVLRFTAKTPSRRWVKDFKVRGWNKAIIKDVVRAFDNLVAPERRSATQPDTGSQPTSRPIFGGAGAAGIPEAAQTPPAELRIEHIAPLQCGPFEFTPDGEIFDSSTDQQWPSGAKFNSYAVGDHTISSTRNGGYLVTDRMGARKYIIFRGGQWQSGDEKF